MSCKELTSKGQQCSREGKYLGCCAQHLNKKINHSIDGVKLIKIVKSNDGIHKFEAEFKRDDGTIFHTKFGAYNMSDYTLHHDKERRERYRIRHTKDLETHNPTSAGYLSYYVLWGDSTSLDKNIKDYKKMFNL